MNAIIAQAQDEFLAVILADDVLVRAEFDALISEAWDPPSAAEPKSQAGRPAPGDRPAEPPSAAVRAAHRAAVTRTMARTRERSPPRKSP